MAVILTPRESLHWILPHLCLHQHFLPSAQTRITHAVQDVVSSALTNQDLWRKEISTSCPLSLKSSPLPPSEPDACPLRNELAQQRAQTLRLSSATEVQRCILHPSEKLHTLTIYTSVTQSDSKPGSDTCDPDFSSKNNGNEIAGAGQEVHKARCLTNLNHLTCSPLGPALSCNPAFPSSQLRGIFLLHTASIRTSSAGPDASLASSHRRPSSPKSCTRGKPETCKPPSARSVTWHLPLRQMMQASWGSWPGSGS